MRAIGFILGFLTIYLIIIHWGDSHANRLLVDASVPTESAPLMLPPQFCPSPWPICPSCAKPRTQV